MIARLLVFAVPLLLVATPVLAQDYQRAALRAPLPDELLGNRCTHPDLGDAGEAAAAICFSIDMTKKPSAGVTVAAVEPMTLEDLKVQMRESFHETGIRKIVSEEAITLANAPDAIAYRGVYSTNSGLRRTWSAYHDGVLIRVVVTIFSKKADGDFEDEIMAEVFGPERFALVAADSLTEPADE